MLKSIFKTSQIVSQWFLWPLLRVTRTQCDVLRFTFKDNPPALPKGRNFFDRQPPPMSIRTFERRMERAMEDKSLGCILIEIERLRAGWSKIQTIHDIIEKARKKGKRIVAFLPEGGGIAEYYLATAATEIWLAPSTQLSLIGLGIEATYLSSAFKKLGLKAQIEAAGKYKTAGENLTQREMTSENKEMLGELLETFEEIVVDAISKTRNIGPVEAKSILSRGPYSPEAAQEKGLVDDIVYPDQLSLKLLAFPSKKEKADICRWSDYARGRHQLGVIPIGRKRIPVLELNGMLVEGRSKGFKGTVGAKDIVKQLKELGKDRSVAAVILYIDSRGGTVGASDQIRRAVERLGEKKPIIAYMANVAASGGYMVASAAHTIVAQPSSITGSIGVVAGKVSGGQLLESLGVHRQVIRRGTHSTFDSPTEGWSGSERRALKDLVDSYYRHFIKVVAQGRKLPEEKIRVSAEGRVWTGEAAKKRNLVDQLGSLSTAIDVARQSSRHAKRAIVEPLRPPRAKFPEFLLPQQISHAFYWASIMESSPVLAIAPFELRIY